MWWCRTQSLAIAMKRVGIAKSTSTQASRLIEAKTVWKAAWGGLCKIGSSRRISTTICLVRRMAQGHRRRFAKQRTVFDRKASELPETMVGRTRGDGRRRRIGAQEPPARQMHPPQPEVAHGAHAEMLVAT